MKIFKITSLFRIIYLGVILIFFINFYSDKNIITYNLDGLQITETSSKEFPLLPRRTKSLDIFFKGILFNISDKTPVILISDDNIKRKSVVESLEFTDDRVIINLGNDIILNVKIDNYGERLALGTSIPKVFPAIRELLIPYTIVDGYNLEEDELSYIINGKDGEFHLKFNDFYKIDKSKNRISLTSNDDRISTLTFSTLSGGELPLAERWYRTYKQPDISHAETIGNFLNIIENGIESVFAPTKFNQESKRWQNLPSRTKFTEKSTVVYLAQGMEKGEYSVRLDKIKELSKQYPRDFSFYSAPFLGNIVKNGTDGYKDDKELLTKVIGYISSENSKLLDIWIPEHYFEGRKINLNKLETILYAQDIKNLSLESLGITLYNLLMIIEYGTTETTALDYIKEISDKIIENIVWDNSGLFLSDDKKHTNSEINLKIGQLLIEASQYESSIYSKPIGESLIKTYIDNSNSLGAVPESYNIETQKFSTQTIAPENSYLALSNNPHLPHYYQKDGIKIWTCSDNININTTANALRITFSYPYDSSSQTNYHFMTIGGVEPYTQLYLRGRAWRADKNFEKWSVGYYYDPELELLYVMPAHTKELEEILITY